MPDSIDSRLVSKVADLARLHVAPEDASRVAAQLARIVEMVEKLNRLDTKGVEPMTHPVALPEHSRADEPGKCLTRDEALANAPDRAEMFFRVPRVVE
jgi:aspartyl-tRNA(Asn)/glutamyl-tRNA(Gln) amidotransferase subunit C